jgi:TonB family protein
LFLVLMIALGGAAPSTAVAQCVRVGGGVPVPTRILHVDPIYPPVAAANRVQGIVILDIAIDAAGAVTSASVLRSIPLLDAAAITAVSQWRYEARPSGSPCLLLTVTVQFTLPPGGSPPSGASPASNLQASVAGNLLTLSWQAPSPPAGAYVIEAGTASGLSNIAIVQVAATPTSLTASVPNGTYFIRVKALNQGVPTAPSNEVVVTVGAGCTAPSAPTLAATVTGTTVTLSWSPASSGTPPYTYTLLAGLSPGSSNLATVPIGALTSFQANVPAGTYFVRVVASNACGTSGSSNEATIVVGAPSGAPLLTFTITPNPVPFLGVFPGCAGSPIPAKFWGYMLRIANQGTGPFTIASFSARSTSPLQPVPVDSAPAPPQLFALAFGGTTIPPQGSLVGQLCVAGDYDDVTLTWTFVDVSGQSFTAPLIRFLRSPF